MQIYYDVTLKDETKNNSISYWADSFSVDGKLKFVSFNCQRFDDSAENPYTPAAYTWPSSMSNEHQEELKHLSQQLDELNNMIQTIKQSQSQSDETK